MNQEDKRPLVVLTGPTAVGKTELSISLAKSIGGEIISADSMQVYKGMDIGTAKIMPDEMQGVKHFLVDELRPDEEFNVVVFQQMAKKAMEEIYDRGNVPIIVGGTGFYIQAILNDIDFTEEEPEYDQSGEVSYREQLSRLAKEKGAEQLHAMLESVDQESAAAIHPNNVKRVIRALEYYHMTGERISVHNKEQRKNKSPYNYAYFVLNNDRQILYDRIDMRVDKMLEAGLVEEVEKLRQRGYTKELVSMQGIGYKEVLAYLDGEYDLERARYIIKRDTRHFAKRQITWFKRESDVSWMNYQDYGNSREEILAAMIKVLRERTII